MAVFGLSVCGLLAFVYWSTVSVIDAQSDATIEAEIAGLEEQYRDRGPFGLVEIIRNRSSDETRRRGIYLLTDPALNPLAGNLSGWPVEARGDPRWVDFRIQSTKTENAPAQIARARTFRLQGGFHLLVGRDLTERAEFRKTITDALIWALGITVLLGVGGGLLLSRYFLHRLDAFNEGSRAILHGDMSQRMPMTGSGDEFDRLAQNLNEMLDQISRLVDGMRGVADNIAHDLRSPISRLRSRLEVTLMDAPDAAQYRAVLEKTIEETDTILATFNALLAIALAESGALRDNFERLDLAAIVRDAAELYEAAAEEQGQTLTLEIDGAPTAKGDRNLLSQALANLLDNALKHTPAGGRITLGAGTGPDGRPEITVADTGPGIPAEARGRVLERFARLDSSRSTEGSGLGLSLVAATARLHDADL
ncbi:MAG: HAMP domain-containing sensor histidine kinase, partial [Gammaproteobacteria bacterium]